LSPAYQPLLFQAISAGRCKTRDELRAVTKALLLAEKRSAEAPKRFSLAALDPEQRPMFADSGPTPKERAALTAVERKIESVVDLVCGGFKDNELTIVSRVSRNNAETMADKLELLEGHLRKMRLALRASAAVAHVTQSV
ncbi:MAG TPA: hypothetical protein VGJ91_20160, partial [Polyangiaceae bacterium]